MMGAFGRGHGFRGLRHGVTGNQGSGTRQAGLCVAFEEERAIFIRMQKDCLWRWLIAMLGLSVVSAAMAEDVSGRGSPVAYRVAAMGDYQIFVKNWDDLAHPVLCALIESSARWDDVFHPAPVMGGKRAFAPERKEYETSELLVIARVVAQSSGGRSQEVWKVEKIVAVGEELEVRYRYDEPRRAAPHRVKEVLGVMPGDDPSRRSFGTGSYRVKEVLGVWIPRHPYQKISFIENGKPVGVLELKQGQWSLPQIGAEVGGQGAGGGK